MSVSPSYPGLYIQELPSSSHAIVPAPTSIAAFVGYVHPYKNPGFDANGLTPVIELFSFRDYETNFGGLFTSGLTDAALPRAVYQFFLNGGSTAYVCGLQPGFVDSTNTTVRLGGSGGTITTGGLTTTGTGGITFTALEPTDVVPMTATVINIRNDPATSTRTMFDLVVTYGTRVETYRGLVLPASVSPTDFASVNSVSSLIKLSPFATADGWGAPFPATITQPTFALNPAPSTPLVTTFIGADFLAAFADNGPLDNVEIFNLLLVPGVADSSVAQRGHGVRRAQARVRHHRPAPSGAGVRDIWDLARADGRLDERRGWSFNSAQPERRLVFSLSELHRSDHRQHHPDGAEWLCRWDIRPHRRLRAAYGRRPRAWPQPSSTLLGQSPAGS